MVLQLSLSKVGARAALAIAAIAVCGGLVFVVFYQFVIGTLADERLLVSRNLLQIPVERFPSSARLNARFAQNEIVEADRDLERAELYAQRAVNLSPYDYRLRLTLASAKEAKGDRVGAEDSLNKALALAPSNGDVHWRMANLLVREGKLAESLEHFKVAVAYDGDLLGTTLDLVFRASGGSVDALTGLVGDDQHAKLKVARFLLQQSRVTEAVSVLGSVDRTARLSSPDSPVFLNALIAAGQFEVAHGLWSSFVGAETPGTPKQETSIWNGGFETDILKDFAQFDWSLLPNEFARLSIDGTVAHGGTRSLKIAFAGRDTTNLDNAIKQLVVVKPGATYKVECYVRTGDLVTSDGPKITVTDGGSNALIAESDPISPGSSDWRPVSVSFVAPAGKAGGSAAVYVSIRRKPKYSFDEPTKGSVWFDDFAIKRQQQAEIEKLQ